MKRRLLNLLTALSLLFALGCLARGLYQELIIGQAEGLYVRDDVGEVVAKISYWWPGLAGATAGAICGILAAADRAARSGRAQRGLCPECGYDLRATAERCPECGRKQNG